MGPVATAIQGKGLRGMMARARTITSRYGLTAGKMDRILGEFVDTLQEFGCGATFPITTAALARSRGVVEKFQAHNIEFAVHGYYHVDHSLLSLDEQISHLGKARQLFQQRGVTCDGFRCPYLRWNEDTIAAVAATGFQYDSSQGLVWDVANNLETETYRQVLQFYGAVPAQDYPALPRIDGEVLRIPYCLPDDESLIDRFHLPPHQPEPNPWLAILDETYRLGELFTLGLHPERIRLCKTWLTHTLRRARTMSPHVWITRLDEAARWWRARLDTRIAITPQDGAILRLQTEGPEGLAILARAVACHNPTENWDGHYRIAAGTEMTFSSPIRPFIGISPASDPTLVSFLRQQGYIVETTSAPGEHAYFLDRQQFSALDERPLLAEIEDGDRPLVRLGRWPRGARSTLVVTGDIDALTLWDYGLRTLGS